MRGAPRPVDRSWRCGSKGMGWTPPGPYDGEVALGECPRAHPRRASRSFVSQKAEAKGLLPQFYRFWTHTSLAQCL